MLDHVTVRPISPAEAEALQQAIMRTTVNGDEPPFFTIANEMAGVHVSTPKGKQP